MRSGSSGFQDRSADLRIIIDSHSQACVIVSGPLTGPNHVIFNTDVLGFRRRLPPGLQLRLRVPVRVCRSADTRLL
jgi:hypothetical protein